MKSGLCSSGHTRILTLLWSDRVCDSQTFFRSLYGTDKAEKLSTVSSLSGMSSLPKARVGFSYLLALAVVAFSRYAWLPWMVLYMHQRKYNSWTSTVSSYGLLLSCFQIGQYAGGMATSSKMLNSSWFTISFMVLTSSFLALCFVTRITIVMLLFVLMGCSGTILSGVSLNVDKNVRQMSFLKRTHDSADGGEALDRNLTSFAFVVLLAGYLYDTRPLSQLPMYSLAVTLALFCLVVLAYFLLLSKTINARGKTMIGSASSSSENDTSNSNNSTNQPLSSGPAVDGGPTYDGPVPANFLSACGGNLAKAQAMYGKTLQWRQDKHVDVILDTPQPFFHDILKYYPHGIHGYSRDGCAVVYETLGKGDMAGLKRLGTSIEQIVWHFELRNELVFRRLLEPDFVRQHGGVVPPYNPPTDPNIIPQPVPRLMTVLDVAGIGFSAVTADVITFIGQSGFLIDNYYPEQVARLVVCNAPWGFGAVFSLIAGVLPEAVKKKVDILGDSQGLDKYIEPSQRPVEYAGTGGPLGTAAGHLEFLALEKRWRERDGTSAGAAQAAAATPAATATAGTGRTAAGDKRWGWPWKAGQGKHKPTVAYLGEENTLKYDYEKGRWYDVSTSEEAAATVTTNKSNESVKPAAAVADPMSLLQEQVKDHGLMLAIHAAHQFGGSLEDGGSMSLRSASFHEGDGFDEPRSRKTAAEAANSATKLLSPVLFLLVLAGYVFCLWVQTALFTLLPVWMVIPASAGGMEYSVREVSLVLSSAAMFALVGHKLLGPRSEHMLKASPVRCLRIGCGLLLIVLLMLPSYMEFTARPADLAAEATPADDVVKAVRVFGRELPAHVPVSYSTFASADHHNVAYDYVYWASSKYTFHHRSILALQLPALLLALMLCALQLCRRASGVLLHLTLSSSFQKPASVRRALNGCIEVTGPTVAALIFSLVYGMRLQYPLDASSFFSLSACTILLVYIGTMLLRVQFRGDYGVLPDYHEPHSTARGLTPSGKLNPLDAGAEISLEGASPLSSGVHHRSPRRTTGGAQRLWGQADNANTTDGTSNSGGSWLARVFAVPMSDASLLYTPVFAAYGSKLHNLKDEFKDL
jgi:hypothetical protein